MKREKGNVIIILTVIIALIIVGLIFVNIIKIPQQLSQTAVNPVETLNPERTTKPDTNQQYQSKAMKFSITLPNNFEVSEKLGSVTINTNEGKIYIDRNGTNYENIEDYLKDLGEKNRFVINNKQNLVINGLSSVMGIISNEKSYFIYKDYIVYTLSTNSESLYDDLDQIAQSFRYTP